MYETKDKKIYRQLVGGKHFHVIFGLSWHFDPLRETNYSQSSSHCSCFTLVSKVLSFILQFPDFDIVLLVCK